MGKRSHLFANVLLRICLMLVALAGFSQSPADAIILFRTADPTANTTAPTNDAAGSGWNYEGIWGVYLGTPIAPHFFLSARHISQAGSNFVYQGVTYTLVGGFPDPFSDLDIWQVNETFPTFAPLYTRSDEKGQGLVAIGRGTQRGSDFIFNDTFRGWNWGAGDSLQRWGENLVSDIVVFDSEPNDGLYATFDPNGLTNECHFSTGDSGGAVFINDNGVWKIAGINSFVDGPLYTDDTGTTGVTAALFEAQDLYYSDQQNPPHYIQITDPTPTGFYATRISSKLAWIESVIDPAGTNNADGISNVLEYAKALNGPVPNYGTPVFAKNSTSVTLTYRRITGNTSLQYVVQQSSNLAKWGQANPQDSVVSTNGNVQSVTSTVSTGSGPLFLRLQVTQN